MKAVYGYTRVSTVKQGQHGVSLQEQREAIAAYAKRNGLRIISWFEEQQTAAKRGRPVFSRMLKLLQKGIADGVIIHKIDRGARNPRDWADLGELIDSGVEVYFAHESIDLHSRGGRLSADIQAVIAADFIRNLREETRKGFYGRLKQGLYPLPAPLGYLDQGKGKSKILDPEKAPLVKKAFELYASGKFNLHTLGDELYRMGLRNKRGGKVTRNGLSTLLNNPFYLGVIRIRTTREHFDGAHPPLVSKAIFDRVQSILKGKFNTRSLHHNFLFRRFLKCKNCGYSLIGEISKGHIYYRCHTKHCPTTGVREERVEEKILETLRTTELCPEHVPALQRKVKRLRERWEEDEKALTNSLEMMLGKVKTRLHGLTDAFIDGIIDKRDYEERKLALLMERKALEEEMLKIAAGRQRMPDRMAQFLERAKDVHSSYVLALPEEKRDLLNQVTSNRLVDRKNVAIELVSPFQEVVNEQKLLYGDPHRDIPRTEGSNVAARGNKPRHEHNEDKVERLFKLLCDYFSKQQVAEEESEAADDQTVSVRDIIPFRRRGPENPTFGAAL